MAEQAHSAISDSDQAMKSNKEKEKWKERLTVLAHLY